MQLTIRNYEARDLPECRVLWRELTEWHREIYEDPTIGGESPELKFDQHLLTVGAEQIWVALDESKVIGLAGLVVKEAEAEVEPMVVAKSYRGLGVGRHLLEVVIQNAQRKNIRLLTVKPVARNVEAIKFFYKQGFGNVGFVELFMDLSKRSWKGGLEIFGYEFYY